MKVEAEQPHRQPAELYRHVRAFRGLEDGGFPHRKNLVAPVGIPPKPDRPAAMIEYDFSIRKRAGEIGELADLRMKQPGVKTQAQRREAGKSVAKGRIEQQPF